MGYGEDITGDDISGRKGVHVNVGGIVCEFRSAYMQVQMVVSATGCLSLASLLAFQDHR